jgi:hypothetical protein
VPRADQTLDRRGELKSAEEGSASNFDLLARACVCVSRGASVGSGGAARICWRAGSTG